jgi:hypothetical protein
MSIARWKPSRDVSWNEPPSSSRLAKAIEWTRISMPPSCFSAFCMRSAIASSLVTSRGSTK